MTVNEQEVKTPETENKVEEKTVATQPTETQVVDKPYKTFATQEEFDKHSAGILNNAKTKAEKELLSLLGLKLDEKDKLAKFKEAYDATLSESEKQAEKLTSLSTEVEGLKASLAEKDAIISALSKVTGKSSEDVSKYVRMAKGLVDENTTIEQALEQVLALTKADSPKTNPTPSGKPLSESSSNPSNGEENPFKTGNLTEQGKLFNLDRDKAREYYYKANGKYPSW